MKITITEGEDLSPDEHPFDFPDSIPTWNVRVTADRGKFIRWFEAIDAANKADEEIEVGSEPVAQAAEWLADRCGEFVFDTVEREDRVTTIRFIESDPADEFVREFGG